ncbi:laforin-like [Equus caballus]|uniref:laforin-like n=1 Tax=Equus caballus TaxID=9796 RepID=UPI0038B23031
MRRAWRSGAESLGMFATTVPARVRLHSRELLICTLMFPDGGCGSRCCGSSEEATSRSAAPPGVGGRFCASGGANETHAAPPRAGRGRLRAPVPPGAQRIPARRPAGATAQAWPLRVGRGGARRRPVQQPLGRAGVPSGFGPTPRSSVLLPEAGARGAQGRRPAGSSSGGADAQRLRGGTWPGSGPRSPGRSRGLQLAAAGGRAEVLVQRPGRRAHLGRARRRRPCSPAAGAGRPPRPACPSRASPSSLGKARERRPPLSGPGAAEDRGARPRGGEKRGSASAGPAVIAGCSANLRALTRGAAPRRSDICPPGRGAPRARPCGRSAPGTPAAPAGDLAGRSARPPRPPPTQSSRPRALVSPGPRPRAAARAPGPARGAAPSPPGRPTEPRRGLRRAVTATTPGRRALVGMGRRVRPLSA